MRLTYVTVACMVAVFCIFGFESLQAQGIKVGVIVPDEGPVEKYGQELVVGAELAGQDFDKVEVVVVESGRFETIAQAYRYLVLEQKVGVIIGVPTAVEGPMLFQTAIEFSVPVVFLADAGLAVDSGSVPSHILQFGLSTVDLYSATLKLWSKKVWDESDTVTRISALFDADDVLAGEHASVITAEVLRSLERAAEFKEVEYESDKLSPYDDALDEIKKFNPDKVVLSGQPWDSANLVSMLPWWADADGIFVAPPSGTPKEMADLASMSTVPVFFGVQFWPSQTNDSSVAVVDRMRDSMGSVPDSYISPVAVEVYDAISVVNAVLNDDEYNATDPWQGIKSFEGLSGALSVMSIDSRYVMASPLRIVTGDGLGGLEAVMLGTSAGF